jgi:large subunit ribosomal protein L25
MSKFEFELTVEPRETYGKGASRRLRARENKILGIIYGGEDKPQPVTLAENHVVKALENEAVFSHILTLNQKGKKERVVLKDIQRHPYRPKILHMDFMRVSENKPITMHVPLHFLGEKTAPGVVLEGGIITHHMIELEIRCLPRDLPEFIEIDISQGTLDTVIHLSQVTLPKGVEMTSVIHGPEDDLPVISIHMPKIVAEDEEKPAAAEGEAPSAEASSEGSEENKTEE